MYDRLQQRIISLVLQIDALKKERDIAMKHRDRLRRMMPDKEEFINQLRDARRDDYQVRICLLMEVYLA